MSEITLEKTCPLCLSSQATPSGPFAERRFFRCPICDLLFAHPNEHLSREEERKRYELHENDPNDSGYRQFLQPVFDLLRPHLSLPMHGLDFGCGPGPLLAQMFSQAGFEVAVWDPFFAANPPALERTYDFVTCTETAEHFYNPRREFSRLNSLLKPGGWICLKTEPLPEQNKWANWYYLRDPTHVSLYHFNTFRWIGAFFHWDFIAHEKSVFLFRKQEKAKEINTSPR